MNNIEYKLNRIDADIAIQTQRLMFPSFIIQKQAKNELSRLRNERELYSKMAENANKRANSADYSKNQVSGRENKKTAKKAV